MRRFALAISAVAALLLGLEKVGLYQFVPGGDTGFQFAPLVSRAGYSLHHENKAGDLISWVQLTVRTNGSQSPSIATLDWTGAPLDIASHPRGDGRHDISISKKPNPPAGEPFVWRAGVPLQIVEGQGAAFEIEDWAVFPSNQAADNLRLAARRRNWTMISWALLTLAAIGTVLAALKEKEQIEPVTARALISAILNDIDGRDEADTKRLRTFLKKVLIEDVPVGQALTHVGLSEAEGWLAKLARFQFQARATSLFQARVENVVTELTRYSERLIANSE